MTLRPRLALSLGDPCGLGPELLLKALPDLAARADLVVVGPRAGLDLLEDLPGRPCRWRWEPGRPPFPTDLAARRLSVSGPGGRGAAWWLDPTPDLEPGQLQLGQGSAASGAATVAAIRAATALVQRGHADALVTLPMSKAAAHLAGFTFPGHTEFLQHLSGAPRTRMAFVSPRLNVVLHTVHQSLRSVIDGLDAAAVAETLAFSAGEFRRLKGWDRPRVALCALNPHAGEGGAFGTEETVLVEALAQARAQVPQADFTGPHPSDSLFHRAASGEFDLVVALYHDQGLIPVKLLEPTTAVNLTLGLPFIRTSPDHGTGFDKAGRWLGDPANLHSAAQLAIDLVRRPGR